MPRSIGCSTSPLIDSCQFERSSPETFTGTRESKKKSSFAVIPLRPRVSSRVSSTRSESVRRMNCSYFSAALRCLRNSHNPIRTNSWRRLIFRIRRVSPDRDISARIANWQVQLMDQPQLRRVKTAGLVSPLDQHSLLTIIIRADGYDPIIGLSAGIVPHG